MTGMFNLKYFQLMIGLSGTSYVEVYVMHTYISTIYYIGIAYIVYRTFY